VPTQAEGLTSKLRAILVATVRRCALNGSPRARPSGIRVDRVTALFLAVLCLGGSLHALHAQNADQRGNHTVAAALEAGPSDGKLQLIFSVSPPIRVLPIVRWLGSARSAPKALAVQTESGGRYSAVVTDIQSVENGQLLIELSDAKSGLRELHGVDLAVGEIRTKGASMNASRDGHFVVY